MGLVNVLKSLEMYMFYIYMGVPPLYLLPTPYILYNLYNYSITLHFVQLFKRDFKVLYNGTDAPFKRTLQRATPFQSNSINATVVL